MHVEIEGFNEPTLPFVVPGRADPVAEELAPALTREMPHTHLREMALLFTMGMGELAPMTWA